MRIVIISDLHGNLTAVSALDDVLKSASADVVLCLGDIAADGPNPRETLAWVQALGCPVVRGNMDDFMLNPYAPTLPDNERQRRLLEVSIWSAEQLTDDDRTFIKSFVSSGTLDTPAGQLVYYHGSPRDNEQLILPDSNEAMLAMLVEPYDQAKIFIGGHTHQVMRRPYQDRLIMNPGSVGLAGHRMSSRETVSAAYAELLIIDIDGTHIQTHFKQVAYSAQAHFDRIKTSKMPNSGWLIEQYART